jgi:hypothetical protein
MIARPREEQNDESTGAFVFILKRIKFMAPLAVAQAFLT